MTSLRNEIDHFDQVRVSSATGDTQTWDSVVFPRVIRRRELEMVMGVVRQEKPARILDLGCGAGWLTRALADRGSRTTGVDASSGLVTRASSIGSKRCEFAVGDCMSLPFRNAAFDMVTSVGVLHHLRVDESLAECSRVTSRGGSLVLMEPNSASPIAGIGRRLASRDIHTEGEVTLHPYRLKESLKLNGWDVIRLNHMFPISFAFAYAFGRTPLRDAQALKFLCPLFEAADRMWEMAPLLKRFSWVVTIVAKKL